ncbi:hypothetical protein ACFP1I_04015 [Dyadobacter subterraneus]|uniref:Uncharacterized protein n=1 Tax=Dyadobacter subterraneus TaxID=2773304 RepID=A0ABR9WKM1_9BACT|nr:hypothetical protein [Dyadobacter subterraneus]MBE9464704.1 hypothetical protein [Dyadobacter subterraneus]
MEDPIKEKLKGLIDKRKENLTAIREFEGLFYDVTRVKLKRIVQDINHEIEKSTDDSLRILYDDPYENRRNSYYALIQMFVGTNKFEFFIDGTKNNPSIKFEGQEFNATVQVSFKLQNEERFKDFKNYRIRELTDTEITNILINFIEKVYSK